MKKNLLWIVAVVVLALAWLGWHLWTIPPAPVGLGHPEIQTLVCTINGSEPITGDYRETHPPLLVEDGLIHIEGSYTATTVLRPTLKLFCRLDPEGVDFDHQGVRLGVQTVVSDDRKSATFELNMDYSKEVGNFDLTLEMIELPMKNLSANRNIVRVRVKFPPKSS